MPELPEVETIRRSLLPVVSGCKIAQVLVSSHDVLSAEDSRVIAGRRIADIRRRGKYLLFPLDGSRTARVWLLVHLRMTGRLLLRQPQEALPRHTHVRILLDKPDQDQIQLVFQDTRRFGRLWVRSAGSSGQMPDELDKLGPEPLDPPLAAEQLAHLLARHQGLTLKAALLNQSIIAGIGNIYADEILFAAGLAPRRRVAGLTTGETENLARTVAVVLADAIGLCGTTLRDYVDGWSREGRYQDCLAVYGRAGLPCRGCGRPLEKAKLAGRTTTWCPVCQPG